MSISKKDKILGSLIGFAIGDAMGATTEFMNQEEIKLKFGKLDNIVGGGWLRLKQGDVTDDTQMMMCIINALMANDPISAPDVPYESHRIIKDIRWNFIDWLRSCPQDVGNACREGISLMANENIYQARYDDECLGNGSLMRALPFALIGRKDFNLMQGRMTHNNIECDMYIEYYTAFIWGLLHTDKPPEFKEDIVIEEPKGNVHSTFNNALYWTLKSKSFEDAIVCAVNHGGDADTIAAITGGLAGTIYGYDNIPERWITQLNADVVDKLARFADYVERNYF